MTLPPFELERYFARYEFNVAYSLCSSDCESVTIGDLLALEPDAGARLEAHWLGYTESPGAPSLRAEISKLYQTIQPAEVLVHAGAEEAILLFMQAALKAGDHAIVHTPCYQSLSQVAESIGCEVTAWRGREEADWALALDELDAMRQPNTRVVVVNLPHNPTGYLMARAEFQRLNDFAAANDLILFCDEVYRESEYQAASRLPSACDLNATAVSLGVMSKTYGLPGLRIGWVATHNHALLERMAQLKDYTTICNSAPSEFLAELGLRHRQALAARNLEIIRSNLHVLDAFFAAHADRFEWVRPTAGPIAFPRYKGGDVETFCHELVTRQGVLLLPGTLFKDTGNHFRLGLGRKNLPQAVERLERFL